MKDQHGPAGGGRGSVPAGSGALAHGQVPAPDDAEKPDAPTNLTKPTWKFIARKTLVACQRDGTTVLPRAWDHLGAG